MEDNIAHRTVGIEAICQGFDREALPGGEVRVGDGGDAARQQLAAHLGYLIQAVMAHSEKGVADENQAEIGLEGLELLDSCIVILHSEALGEEHPDIGVAGVPGKEVLVETVQQADGTGGVARGLYDFQDTAAQVKGVPLF